MLIYLYYLCCCCSSSSYSSSFSPSPSFPSSSYSSAATIMTHFSTMIPLSRVIDRSCQQLFFDFSFRKRFFRLPAFSFDVKPANINEMLTEILFKCFQNVFPSFVILSDDHVGPISFVGDRSDFIFEFSGRPRIFNIRVPKIRKISSDGGNNFYGITKSFTRQLK